MFKASGDVARPMSKIAILVHMEFNPLSSKPCTSSKPSRQHGRGALMFLRRTCRRLFPYLSKFPKGLRLFHCFAWTFQFQPLRPPPATRFYVLFPYAITFYLFSTTTSQFSRMRRSSGSAISRSKPSDATSVSPFRLVVRKIGFRFLVLSSTSSQN